MFKKPPFGIFLLSEDGCFVRMLLHLITCHPRVAGNKNLSFFVKSGL
jgi:hypothetical protein